ncbi:MAG: hypothetical protein JNM40_26210 [Myxococcales bacterium]|nr:hypothetical protein [Myxococcales bacterium]
MDSKHINSSSLNHQLAGALTRLAKLFRRVGQGIADYVLMSGELQSPVRTPEVAAFTALAAARAKRRAASGTPAAALLVSASLSL